MGKSKPRISVLKIPSSETIKIRRRLKDWEEANKNGPNN